MTVIDHISWKFWVHSQSLVRSETIQGHQFDRTFNCERTQTMESVPTIYRLEDN